MKLVTIVQTGNAFKVYDKEKGALIGMVSIITLTKFLGQNLWRLA